MNVKEFYKGTPVFITGGTGFIGSNLVLALLKLGAHVKCLVRKGSKGWRLRNVSEKIEWIEGDLATDSEEFWGSVCKDSKLVFHIGASGVMYNPDHYWKDLVKINVMGTCALIYGAAIAGVKRIIVASTSAEYGNISLPNCKISANMPLSPVNIYGASKGASTLLTKVCLEVNGIEGLVLRLFAVYGPRELPPKLIPTLINDALAGKAVKLTGGKQVRDFCFVEDVVQAFLHAGCAKLSKSPLILNIGSGNEFSIAEVAKIITELIPENGGIELGALPYRPDEIWRMAPNITETQKILNWRAKYTLEGGLRKTIEWFRENPAAGEEYFHPLRLAKAEYN